MSNFYPPGMEPERMILAIDFDGVIHDADRGYHDGTCYGKPIPGAIDAIKYLSNKYDIVIYSAKARMDRPLVNEKDGVELIYEWCVLHGLKDYIRDITCIKPRAELYIDDNAYRFDNWYNILKFVNDTL